MSGGSEMITVLTGENSFAIEQALSQLIADANIAPERYDSEMLELKHMLDILMGASLFSSERLVIIRGLSASKEAWSALVDLLPRVDIDLQLVLVEPSIDKRTKTYKALEKAATIKEFPLLSERDSRQAEQWLIDEAKQLKVQLDTQVARAILARNKVLSAKGQPVFDQWQAKYALEKLAVLGEITLKNVEDYIDTQPTDSVFRIFETTLKGDVATLRRLLRDIALREDPYRVFGLLTGQVFQLAALQSAGNMSSAELAKKIGAHPFALQNLAPFARNIQKDELREIVVAFRAADEAMKQSKAESWVLIERALIKTALITAK